MDVYAINSWLLETCATASLVPLPSATINKSENILIETELYNLRLLITFYLYIITYCTIVDLYLCHISLGLPECLHHLHQLL